MYSIILSSFSLNSKKTEQIRKRIIFPILPIFKGGKIRWLKEICIIERQYIVWYTMVSRMNGKTLDTISKTKWILESIED